MKKGFTLIELLIVIAIIAIIAGAVLVAMNPAKRIADANNGRRWEEVNSILNAIQQYVVDNTGSLPKCDGVTDGSPTDDYSIQDPTGTTGKPVYQHVGRCTTGCDTGATGLVCDLGALITSGYLSSMPKAPNTTSTEANTGYDVYLSAAASTNVCVSAPDWQRNGSQGNNPIVVCR